MAKRNHKPEHHVAETPSNLSSRPLPYFRKLKVRRGYYEQPYSPSPFGLSYAPKPPVPWVYIEGYWLNQAGFEIGTPLDVEVSHGRIVLTART
ncbi:MAG: SymE family type I addiction module toxin [Alcanivorax sp.]|uniref:SymE family type I addiction module toxin n=1 Tax=Alloalcanivorax marinus TaxID=1177169 RepID=UPI00195EB07A|nr:SymE family type I addiction module toxin [Alloalcanivorax marinus]MBM7332849.1 type I toxin-antitoxin system SymE family toxin [Alloalcanivorax marinus]